LNLARALLGRFAVVEALEDAQENAERRRFLRRDWREGIVETAPSKTYSQSNVACPDNHSEAR
jgi:hypothetical protein